MHFCHEELYALLLLLPGLKYLQMRIRAHRATCKHECPEPAPEAKESTVSQ
jgi:hypothetical protein